jgi:hypothetical protein
MRRTERRVDDRTRIHVDSPGGCRCGPAPAPAGLVWPLPVRQWGRAAALLRLHPHGLPGRQQRAAGRDAARLQPDTARVAVATQWNELAEEHNFIVAYPGQTLAVHPGAITGSNGESGDRPADDAAGAPAMIAGSPAPRL